MMREVKIKDIRRKTTIPKAVIKRAAEVAYGLRPPSVSKTADAVEKKQIKKHSKAA